MSADPIPPRQRWTQRIGRVLLRAAIALFCLGLLVRLTVRDRILVANTIYYATPWSVLCALGIVSAFWTKSRLRRRWATAIAMTALACGAMWVWSAWLFRAAPSDGNGIRVMTWNLSHGRWGLAGLAAEAARLNPDLGVFIEADPSRLDVRAIMKAAFPKHHVFLLGGGIVLVSRWPGGEARAYQIGSGEVESRIREIDLATPGGIWTVFSCDISSNTLYQREPHFRELASRIAGCPNPVLIAGDFNTPLDSVHLDHLRALGLVEAFETGGSGYLPTWPVPLPVLSLDQIWMSTQFQPVHCVRRWHWRTDHAAVIATIRDAD
jgi:vancomycin resistance protein VanJ